jgi:hypothetical protein
MPSNTNLAQMLPSLTKMFFEMLGIDMKKLRVIHGYKEMIGMDMIYKILNNISNKEE